MVDIIFKCASVLLVFSALGGNVYAICILVGIIAINFGLDRYQRSLDPKAYDEARAQKLEEIKRQENELAKEKKAASVAAIKFYNEYKMANEVIPKSKWILMSQEEKSLVFRRRENLIESYNSLSCDVKAYLESTYGLKPPFLSVR